MQLILSIIKQWRLIAVVALAASLVAAGWYVNGLRADVAQMRVITRQAELTAEHRADESRRLRREIENRERVEKQLQQWREDTAGRFDEIRSGIREDMKNATDEMRECYDVAVPDSVFERLRDSAAGD